MDLIQPLFIPFVIYHHIKVSRGIAPFKVCLPCLLMCFQILFLHISWCVFPTLNRDKCLLNKPTVCWPLTAHASLCFWLWWCLHRTKQTKLTAVSVVYIRWQMCVSNGEEENDPIFTLLGFTFQFLHISSNSLGLKWI